MELLELQGDDRKRVRLRIVAAIEEGVSDRARDVIHAIS